MKNTDSTDSRFVQWSSALNWGCKIGLLGFSLSFYNGESDVPIENAFVFGFLFLIIISLGIESLLRIYSTEETADFTSINIAGAASSVSLLLTFLFLEQISVATNYKINLPQLFLLAFLIPYSICFVYLLSRKPK